jgi:molybdenum cofactor cytidylyltransferase
MEVTCIILAAGLSRRFGKNKLLEPGAGGQTLLERALGACAEYPVVAVALPETAAALRESRARIVLNHEPDLGMSHSLKLANAVIDPSHAIAVLPADLAKITADDVRAVIASSTDSDVTFPALPDGTPGHPVVFSPKARAGIVDLHDGDLIRELRDRSDLRRRIIERDVPGPYVDIDTAADFAALH